MATFFHIVYVHPVELGEPNLAKVIQEKEFGTRVEAEDWIKYVNLKYKHDMIRAVYHGCVNHETGELV